MCAGVAFVVTVQKCYGIGIDKRRSMCYNVNVMKRGRSALMRILRNLHCWIHRHEWIEFIAEQDGGNVLVRECLVCFRREAWVRLLVFGQYMRGRWVKH